MTVTIARVVAQLAAFTWIAGAVFLVAALVGVLVHSAGFWRLEAGKEAVPPER